MTDCIYAFCASSLLFFFSSRRRHTRSLCDWSSDVCSSDLVRDSLPDSGLNADDVRPLALQAMRSHDPVTSTDIAGGRYAVVAYPLVRGKNLVGVAVFAATLDEVEGNVDLIRRQILLSGGIALAIALAAGYLVARAL